MLMATKYNDLYQYFISNTKVSDLDLPSTDEGKYDLIKNGVSLYNNRFRTDISLDNNAEEISIDLDNDQFIIISYYMRLVILKNSLSYKNSIFSTFSKEIGVKFINSQVNSLESDIQECNESIDLIVFHSDDNDLMG